MNTTCGVFLIDCLGRILVCHVTGRPRSGQGSWSIPKGLADEGESHPEAARRELMEETGIEIAAEALVEIGSSRYKTQDKTLVAFAAMLVRSGDDMACNCHSFFERDGCMIPEVDAFEWVRPETAWLMLHETQVGLLGTVEAIIRANGK